MPITTHQTEDAPQSATQKRTFNAVFVIVSTLVAILGSIIGVQLISELGVTPNTSIIGVLIAMIIARIPLGWFRQFRSIENQNLIQTTISSATFGAANSLLLPIGVPYALGMPNLVWPMLIGSGIALAIDVFIFYKVFDSKLFGANEAWPVGVASAEALYAGDEGGKKAGLLGIGILVGVFGSFFGVSMSAFGVAFIGNIWALGFFGVGLLISGYTLPLTGFDINAHYIPHGMMVGAGLVALAQFLFMMLRRKKPEEAAGSLETHAPRERVEAGTAAEAATPGSPDSTSSDRPGDASAATGHTEEHEYTRSERTVRRAFLLGSVLYMSGALLLAVLGGLFSELSVWGIIGFVLFAGIVTFCHEIIVGIAAMHSGWFPAFAVSLISLIIGILLGFPPVALALLTGYVAATGPAFADMGYDFKTGALIRRGVPVGQELYGRRQQLKAAVIGFVVAFVVVALAHESLFAQGLIPPVDKVFATTIEAGLSGDVAQQIFLWAIPGAILQLVGGPKRQIGIMFATGLLIFNPLAGWAVVIGIIIRFTALKIWGQKAEGPMYTLAAGAIAGDALYSFFSSLWKVR